MICSNTWIARVQLNFVFWSRTDSHIRCYFFVEIYIVLNASVFYNLIKIYNKDIGLKWLTSSVDPPPFPVINEVFLNLHTDMMIMPGICKRSLAGIHVCHDLLIFNDLIISVISPVDMSYYEHKIIIL